MEINNEYREVQNRMIAQGYEPIMPITAYRFYPGDDDDPPRYGYSEQTFLLFGKQFGNITIFKVCGTKNEYDVQKIGSRRIYRYDRITGNVIKEVEVNAKFVRKYEVFYEEEGKYHTFYDEYHFNLMY